jgi:hypothetical protein
MTLRNLSGCKRANTFQGLGDFNQALVWYHRVLEIDERYVPNRLWSIVLCG